MRNDTMLLTAQEIIGTGVAGLFTILWFDLRKLPAQISKWRMERDGLKAEIIAEVLTKDKHEDLCRIATLEQNEFLLEKFSDMLDEKFRKNGFVRVP